MLLRHIRNREFDMDLGAADFLFTEDIARAAATDDRAVFDRPLGRAAVLVHPLRGILAVEQDYRVGGWGADGFGWRDHRWLRRRMILGTTNEDRQIGRAS